LIKLWPPLLRWSFGITMVALLGMFWSSVYTMMLNMSLEVWCLGKVIEMGLGGPRQYQSSS
jgi:hypothetical protein